MDTRLSLSPPTESLGTRLVLGVRHMYAKEHIPSSMNKYNCTAIKYAQLSVSLGMKRLKNLCCSSTHTLLFQIAIWRQASVIKAVFILRATNPQQTLNFRRTGLVEIHRLRMQITRSRDCAHVLHNLKVGCVISRLEHNLRVLRMHNAISRLRGTYI